MNPRSGGVYFEIYAGTSGVILLQNIVDGTQPLAIMSSIDKSIEFVGDIDIPNYYNKTELDTLIANINLSNYYNKTEVDAIVANINLSNYYTKTEVDDIDHELSTRIVNTYTKTEVDTLLFTNYASISFIALTLQSYSTTDQITEADYNKTETDDLFTIYTSIADMNLALQPY